MLKKSTSYLATADRRVAARDSKREHAMPRESTLAFLRQFARAYHFECALAPAQAGMVLN